MLAGVEAMYAARLRDEITDAEVFVAVDKAVAVDDDDEKPAQTQEQ